MKRMVLKLELNDIKDKQKAIKAVSILQGIDSIGTDMKAQTTTAIGSVDPVSVVTRLRKFWHTNVVSIGPSKEEPKKEETNKEEKKEEAKQQELKKELQEEMAPESVNPQKIYYNPHTTTQNYYVHSAQENPNFCNNM